MRFKQIKLRGPLCDHSHTNTFQNKMALGKVILELYISIQGIVQSESQHSLLLALLIFLSKLYC